MTPERTRQVWWLAASAAVLLASLLLETRGTEEVCIGGAGGVALPSTCLLRSASGFECPACGLTRSFVAFAHGRVGAAFAFHPLGPVFFLFFLFQIPFRIAVLLGRGRAFAGPFPAWPLVAVAAGLAVPWAVRLGMRLC